MTLRKPCYQTRLSKEFEIHDTQQWENMCKILPNYPTSITDYLVIYCVRMLIYVNGR